jgi:cation diffusion facilitator CzcD-associated flavoprotein CzcO
MANNTVAIIGGGPAGIVAARWLAAQQFEPVIFEQSDGVGGQWNGSAAHSGVWPAMRTNTSRVMTAFSDLEHPATTNVFPRNQEVLTYLRTYANQFDLTRRVQLRSRVERLASAGDGKGWSLAIRVGDATRTETFPRVVIANGRHHRPQIPVVSGLDQFTGRLGAAHTFAYKDPERYRGARVLVCGCSISALEIASDLAMLGAARVVTANRRQRYVLQKQLGGVPTDYRAFTRFAALAGEAFPPEMNAAGLREFILQTSGSPEQYGAPKPADNVFAAGITMSHHYLPLVAEGRITCRPWLEEVRGQTVRFTDGSEEDFDAILFGTGFALDMPFLSDELRRLLDVDDEHIDLYKATFHPDLDGLAAIGAYDQVGPYFPVVELAARWIAYVWSGVRPMPTREEMEAGISAYRSRRSGPQSVPMHVAALLFARAAGVEPDTAKWPELLRALMFGPLAAVGFRLEGPDALPDAPQRFAAAAAAFGAIASSTLAPPEAGRLQALAAARRDEPLALLLARMSGAGAS